MSTEYITLSQATKLAPTRPSTHCIWRWARLGVKGRNGRRVKLQHIRVGGKIFVTAEWLDAFFAELTAADSQHFERTADAPTSSREGRSKSARAKAIAAAETELDARGC